MNKCHPEFSFLKKSSICMGNMNKNYTSHLTLLLFFFCRHPSFHLGRPKSYTLRIEDADLREIGTPPCSIWRSKKSDLPNTSYNCARKEIADDLLSIVRGKGNTNFPGLHVGSFQKNRQVAKATSVGQTDLEIQRIGIVLNATTYSILCIDFQEHRYIYTCRKINKGEVALTNDVVNQFANWDTSGCAGSAGSGTSSGGAGSAGGTVWMVGMVASPVAAPPPTPCMCCHAKLKDL